jgi:pimeloyl-ACP methyl ester carboxylesterase
MSELSVHELESSRTPGQRLHLRERLPQGKAPEAVERAVVCMHGATMAGGLFDLPVAGYSLLQRLAGAGFAAYALDARGYGRSGRPPQMAEPADRNAPFARTAEVIEDLAEAFDFVRARTGLATPSLIGYSWGTVISGLFVTTYPGLVDRLVLAAPVYSARNEPWLKVVTDPDDAGRFNPALGAYRLVSEADTIKRWDGQIGPADPSEWREPAMLAALVADFMSTDEAAANLDPPAVRVPNGVLRDVFEIFNERPIYPAAEITMPTLVIRGADDPESTDPDARGLFDTLGAAEKRYVVIGNGSHFLFGERQGWQLYDEIERFLLPAR